MFDFALPDSLRALSGDAAAQPPALFDDRAVFRAEFAHIFGRPWMAVDHLSRLPSTGSFFTFDVVRRSIIVVRAGEGRCHALRNRCIHAGYPLCEADDGQLDKLHCRYHGWEYALDGRLTAAPQVADGFRIDGQRLPVYPLRLWHGLILVHPSMQDDPDAAAAPAPPVPAWFAASRVTERRQVSVAANWKLLRAALPREDGADCVVFGPLSLLLAHADGAVLLRLVPRSPQETRVETVWLAADDATRGPARDAAADPIESRLRRIAELATTDPRPRLDPPFLRWYGSLLPTDAER